MLELRELKPVLLIVGILGGLYAAFVALIYLRQRSMLYFPSHGFVETKLVPWKAGGRLLGYCREVPHPRTVWLMMHGNGGQAAQRDYVLQCIDKRDALYVLEYPGYGSRDGSPSKAAFNEAAAEAYRELRAQHGGIPVGVIGESIGTGPASFLAAATPPPDKIVLVVPFDTLANVAAKRMPLVPVRMLLRDAWDNVAALKRYSGPVDIFAAEQDAVIPIEHARALAAAVPHAKIRTLTGEHNNWSHDGQVRIER